MKKLIDESITLYRKTCQLSGEVSGRFPSAETRRDAKDCIRMLELVFSFHHKIMVALGIIRASRNTEEEISKMCQQYGVKIAKQILS